MKTYNVFVLMSFNSKYDFVYESIRNSVDSYNETSTTSINLKRADDFLHTKGSKVQVIVDQMRQADFLILDFSERTENVMWEFGYAQCLNKRIIALDCSSESNPFNVGETDKLKYTLSRKGLDELEAKLLIIFQATIGAVNTDNQVLFEDGDVKHFWKTIEECLKSVPRASITHKLVTNELDRIARRITAIEKSHFELRNVKPPDEITEYYCNYLSQLEGMDSSFSTVTCCDFWVTISQKNKDKRYLLENKRALERGAKISRVFVVPHDAYTKTNASCRNLMQDVLGEHRQWLKSFPHQIEARVITDDGSQKKSSYRNLGIISKSDELLLFIPQYDTDGVMEKTVFYYGKKGNSKYEIRNALASFSYAREQAIPLQEIQSHWLIDN